MARQGSRRRKRVLIAGVSAFASLALMSPFVAHGQELPSDDVEVSDTQAQEAETEPSAGVLIETGVVDVAPDDPAPPLPYDPNKPEEEMPLRPGDEQTGAVGRLDTSPQVLRAGCRPFYNPNRGRTYTVCGDILAKYEQLGGPGGFLGLPITDEVRNPDGIGMRTAFENNSSIYWHPKVGAFQIGGSIGARWGDLGYETSPLGYPTTDEITNPDGVGKRNWFQGGAIYWHQATGAWEVWGKILEKFALGGYEVRWGYPTGPEVGPGYTPEAAPSYGGYSQPFHNGWIYWNLVPPVCGELRVDAVHDSGKNPGTVNVHLGLPGGKNQCNRPVRTMGFEARMWDHGFEFLPNPYQLHQDWTTPKDSPFRNVRYMITNVQGGPCQSVNGRVMSAEGRGYMVDYDGTSYAIPKKEGMWSVIACRK